MQKTGELEDLSCSGNMHFYTLCVQKSDSTWFLAVSPGLGVCHPVQDVAREASLENLASEQFQSLLHLAPTPSTPLLNPRSSRSSCSTLGSKHSLLKTTLLIEIQTLHGSGLKEIGEMKFSSRALVSLKGTPCQWCRPPVLSVQANLSGGESLTALLTNSVAAAQCGRFACCKEKEYVIIPVPPWIFWLASNTIPLVIKWGRENRWSPCQILFSS